MAGYPDMPEELLLKALFQKYNKNARPATVLMPVVTVDHGMDLIRINSFEPQGYPNDTNFKLWYPWGLTGIPDTPLRTTGNPWDIPRNSKNTLIIQNHNS
uniref:Neurotransmitter-gated ion-channel ligand-binding domain-containing protein n=1 Tax=Magallana gigas TaxID=29159 RepID=K1QME1_MAGGI